MQKRILLIAILGCLTFNSHAQVIDDDDHYDSSLSRFEIYAVASGMKTIDVVETGIVRSPVLNQPLASSPTGLASGVRTGLVWHYGNFGLITDFGVHRYSDRTGSTSISPLMLGLRLDSEERFRTSFFGEGLAGAYRWTVSSGTTKFATVKGIVSGGAGMDIRLSRHLVWRVFEIQIAIADARNGPLLTGGPSTGLAYRFGR